MRKKDTMKIIICTHEEDASLVLDNRPMTRKSHGYLKPLCTDIMSCR